MIHFFLLFLLPLLAITILYTRVGITLWNSSKNRLPWTPGTRTTANSSVSRSSSSPTISNEESSSSTSGGSGSRGTSLRRKRSRRGSRNKRRCRHNYHDCTIDHKTAVPATFNSVFYKNCRNSMMNGKSDTPCLVVTIENKCHLVRPNDTRLMPVDGLLENGNQRPSSINNHHHQHRHHGKVLFPPGADDARVNNGHVTDPEPGLGYTFRRKRVIKRLSRAKNLRGGREALKSRQTVVRMLIVIVLTFAVCNFPFHLRKMIQYWWPNYDYVSVFSTLATPLTHLIMYANCAINPIIYAFMSKTFWSSFKELVCCNWKKPQCGYREPSTQIIPLRSPRINSRSEERDFSLTEES